MCTAVTPSHSHPGRAGDTLFGRPLHQPGPGIGWISPCVLLDSVPTTGWIAFAVCADLLSFHSLAAASLLSASWRTGPRADFPTCTNWHPQTPTVLGNKEKLPGFNSSFDSSAPSTPLYTGFGHSLKISKTR